MGNENSALIKQDELAAKYKEMGLVYYTDKEEVMNSVSHGIGSFFGLAAAVGLALVANGKFISTLAAFIFGLGIIIPFLNSALYHGFKNFSRKRTWRRVDHAGIAFIIMANSAPLCLVIGASAGNYVLLGITVVLCLTNVFLCLYDLKKFSKVALIIDLFCAALGVTGYFLNRAGIPFSGKLFYIGGSVFCLLGLVFYGIKKRYMHTVFHILMLIGTMLYYGALLEVVRVL